MKRVAILMYHQVESGAPRTPLCCPQDLFARQMRALGRSQRPLVTLRDVVRAARGEASIPIGAVAVTFDDGYGGFFDHALPVLREHGVPATVFAVAGKLGGYDDWVAAGNSARRRLMDGAQLRQLPAAGVDVGSHSLTHPRLPEVSDEELERELTDSRDRLSQVIGRTVDLLAYPFGGYDDRVCAAAAAAGYIGACSTRSGFNAWGADPLALRRINIQGTDSLHVFERKLDLGVGDWSMRAELSYLAERLRRRLRGRHWEGEMR